MAAATAVGWQGFGSHLAATTNRNNVHGGRVQQFPALRWLGGCGGWKGGEVMVAAGGFLMMEALFMS